MTSPIRHGFTGFFLILVSHIFLACSAPYYLVTSDFVVADNQEAPPEIVESPSYLSAIPQIQYLTVKAPEGCANETATQSSGEAVGQSLLLKTTCGIEMSELERALTKAGFQVISWNVLQNKVAKEELTPHAASKELGAEVLFQINSLERSIIQAGHNARWERHFYESNPEGEQLKPVSLPPREGHQLLDHIKEKETSLLSQERLGVTMNASASSVKTGETIWFYEWTHAEAREDNEAVKVLAVCDNGTCRAISRQDQKKSEEAALISGSTEAISKQKSVKDRQNAIYHRLLRALVTNLAHSFKHPSLTSPHQPQSP
ncbi:MAG: hypothetical protein R3B74_11420 [Nitrospirales bacterium]|nr:hypothetical protein [Nitrospirales bacterium]